MPMKNRIYRLTSGREVTVQEIMNATGLSKPGAYKRLAHNRDDDAVFTKAGVNRGKPRPVGMEWKSKPVQVAMGIPINPEYLDGQVRGESSFDREGNRLSYAEREALTRYRREQRKAWRDSTNNIKNRSSYG